MNSYEEYKHIYDTKLETLNPAQQEVVLKSVRLKALTAYSFTMKHFDNAPIMQSYLNYLGFQDAILAEDFRPSMMNRDLLYKSLFAFHQLPSFEADSFEWTPPVIFKGKVLDLGPHFFQWIKDCNTAELWDGDKNLFDVLDAKYPVFKKDNYGEIVEWRKRDPLIIQATQDRMK